MAKCSFRIYKNDGSYTTVVPACLQESRELSDFDKYVNEQGGAFTVTTVLAGEFNIDATHISQIKICQPNNDVEFSLIVANPYLIPVLNDVETREIFGYERYPYNGKAVNVDNDVFKEMKSYLFEMLINNSERFFNDVYTNNNVFSNFLHQYVNLYKQGAYSEEDARNLEELKSKIIKGLSMYQNYRGLCKARYQYENNQRYVQRRNNNVAQGIEIRPRNPEYNPSRFPQEPLYETNQYVNDLGEEREEFLEEEELWSEDCYGKRR